MTRRSLFLRALLTLALASTSPLSLAGEGVDRIKRAGKIIFAVDPTYPPMESEDKDGKPIGLDIDLAREIAKRLGVTAEFKTIPWDGILAGLNSRRYDAIISSMNITEERKRMATFVEYARVTQLWMTKPGKKFGGETDLADKVIAVQADTTAFEYLEKLKKQGTKLKQVKAFGLATDVFAALDSGQADILIVDEPVGKYHAVKMPDRLVIQGQAIGALPVGIALNKKDEDLRVEIQKIIDQMKKDGSFSKIARTWLNGELGV